MLVYELLTGRLPFDQNLPTFQQMMAKVGGETIDPQQFNPQISSETRAALLAGLDRNPLNRPRSAMEFCRLLSARSPAPSATAPSASAGPVAAAASAARARGGVAVRTVFVSYSHKDAEWLERVRVHLRPLERQGLLKLWDDTRIQPGTRWLEEIEEHLEAASSAILLVSADFLASDFCTEDELPRLLKRAADRGVRILPVIVSPCQLSVAPTLAAIQAVNPPSRTLVEMTEGEQERVLSALAAAVGDALLRRAGA
jgi:hypothetical protein